MKKITIAIDGHSSCGKSTMAKDLAREVGYVYVDTGAMYRSVTLYALRKGLFNDDGSVRTDALEAEMQHIRISFKFNPETGRPDTYLNGECVERGAGDTLTRGVEPRQPYRCRPLRAHSDGGPTTADGQG